MKTATALAALLIGFLANAPQILAADTPDDGLGVTLPSGVSAKEIVQAIAPEANPALVTLVGMKKWPHRENTYVVVACFATSEAEFKFETSMAHGRQAHCDAGYGNGKLDGYAPKNVYLGMVEYSTKLKVIATYGKSLDVAVSWRNSQLDSPGFIGEDSRLYPYNYSKFDFAKYKISDDEIAFGIRVGWFEGFAAGGADYAGLILFTVSKGKITNVLSEPVSFSKDLAGEFYKNGTRGHNFSDGTNLVVVSSTKTNGHYDLQLKEARGKWKKTFKWSAEENRYSAPE